MSIHASLPTLPPEAPDSKAPTLLPSGDPAPFIDLPIGAAQKVGDYKILGTLGSGGMGVVYKALDQKLGRVVALKMLQVGREANPEEIQRFRNEAETLGCLQHPNVVQVFDFGVHDGAPFLVMEYVTGGGLDKKLSGTPQQPRRAAEWLEQIARAIHAAHEKGIIHRDLKPANVLMTAEGKPKITDFGLAKQLEANHGLTQTGAVMGTPSYMAPEQAEGKKDVGPAADVYSLGAILYECLTGRPPFRGATLQETLEQVCNADPAPPSRLVPRLPRDLQTVCLKCLHKVPGRRYDSALEFADDLHHFLEGLPVKARPAHSIEKLFRTVARRPLRAALVLAGVLVFALAVVLGLVMRDQSQKDEMSRQKEAAIQARAAEDQARQSLQNLQQMLELTMNGDLNTPAGLGRLRQNLTRHADALDADADGAADKAAVLAGAFYRLATLMREHSDLHHAIPVLDRAEKLATFAGRPDDFAGRMRLARILQERAQVRLINTDMSDNDAAAADCRAALLLLAEHKDAAAANPECARLRAEILHNFAVATSHQTADHKESLGHFHEAETLLRALVKRPDAAEADRRHLARTLGFMGALYLNVGRFRDAGRAYWESHRIREKLHNDSPRDAHDKHQLARSWANFGGYQTRLNALETALHFYRLSEKLRRELHVKQPDNKEFTLELTGVWNRIAELDLLAAPEGIDAEGLAETGKRLDECARALAALLEDCHDDAGAAARVYSRLGECHALQARLALAPAKPDAAALERARGAARTATDDLEKVKEYRKHLSENELYVQAAASAMSIEIYLKTRGEYVKNPADLYNPCKQTLTKALKDGYRHLPPREMARDRAFRAVIDMDWFQALLKQAGQGADAAQPRAEEKSAAKQP